MYKIVFPIVIFVLAAFFVYRTWTNHKAGEEQLALGQAFLTENATKPDVQMTESGLQYTVLSEGTGDVHPKANSKVTVHYEGKLLDGTVFDSSYQRNEPIRGYSDLRFLWPTLQLSQLAVALTASSASCLAWG